MTTTPRSVELTRSQMLAYRAAVQQLPPRPGTDPVRDGVLLTGIQDSPPGRTATVALRARGLTVDPGRLALVHSLRGAPHLHRVDDAAGLASVLRGLHVADFAPDQFGQFGQTMTDHGIDFGSALGQIAEAMREVYADGKPRTKGELSTALNDMVDSRLRPWCARCGVHHVQDVLFRYATLQAGLGIVVEPGGWRYQALPSDAASDAASPSDPASPSDTRSSSAARSPSEATPQSEALADSALSLTTLVRRFLRLCGACRPEHLARWLSLRPAAARRLFDGLGDALVPVTVAGRRAWMHQDDLDQARQLEPATGVWLLPPYDPVTEVADRELLVPEVARRSRVWRAVGNPGVLLVRGEVAGVWRQRATARRVTLTVEPFATLTATDQEAAQRHAETLRDPAGPPVIATFAAG